MYVISGFAFYSCRTLNLYKCIGETTCVEAGSVNSASSLKNSEHKVVTVVGGLIFFMQWVDKYVQIWYNESMKDPKKRLRNTWKLMLRRCQLSDDGAYRWYGGRGINVCVEWFVFESFYEWAKDIYRPGLQLDREDNDGDYGPDNCRFVTHEVNNCNRSKQCNNTSGYVGVTYRWREENYEAKIRYRRKAIHLGRFSTSEEAVGARNEYIKLNDLPFQIQEVL